MLGSLAYRRADLVKQSITQCQIQHWHVDAEGSQATGAITRGLLLSCSPRIRGLFLKVTLEQHIGSARWRRALLHVMVCSRGGAVVSFLKRG